MLLKRALLIGLLALLSWPAIQAKFPLVDVGPLDGWATPPAPHPEFSYQQLIEGSYQPQLEAYLQDRLGFRPWLIRLNFQLAYSVFNTLRANGLVKGGNEVLFQDWPIDSYYGRDFIGDKPIRVWARKLRLIQDSLSRRGILFVFAIAPNKARYYAEDIPLTWRGPQLRSNYSAAVEELRANGVNLIDFPALFMRMKDTASYPLFPRGGTHWSGYGATLAADTLMRYLEQRGHFDLPDYRVVGRTLTDSARGTDGDIASALNLIRPPATFRMAYPKIQYDAPRPGQKKPNVLIVGDSFTWTLIDFYDYFPALFDSKSSFWYYHTRVGWPGQAPLGKNVEYAPAVGSLDGRAEIERRDIVLLLYSEYNLKHLDYGFAKYTYPYYHQFSGPDSARIKAIEQRLANDWDRLSQFQKEAAEHQTSFEDYLHSLAIDEFDAEQ
jgi:hypothetical protein